MGTAYHAVNLYLFVNAGKILLAYVSNLDDFACIYLLGGINRGPYSLLLRPIDVLEEVCCQLGFAHFAILALT